MELDSPEAQLYALKYADSDAKANANISAASVKDDTTNKGFSSLFRFLSVRHVIYSSIC